MYRKQNCYFYSALLIFFIVFNNNNFSQTDSIKTPNPFTGIEDSLLVSDSTITKHQPKPFLITRSKTLINDSGFEDILEKKMIDFEDYRYTGNLIPLLPFGNLHDFGSLGTPSEPSIYTFGYGNISLIVDGNSLTNKLNGSIDLNRLQVESINSITISPIHRSFLFGFENNPAAIIINTADTLLSKPISRIRYYQASNEEGFIDASFSARVLSKLALSLRLSNSSIDENYTNTEFGVWKFNVKGIYKISDSLFTSLDYYHLKLNTSLNGGIDVNTLLQSSTDLASDIYFTSSPVLYDSTNNTSSMNKFNAGFYGYFLPGGKTKFTTTYSHNKEKFKQSFTDTTNIDYSDIYETFDLQLFHEIKNKLFFSNISLGYQSINFNTESRINNETLTSYYVSVIAGKKFFNGLLTPTIFGKISEYDNQKNSGYGLDVIFEPLKNTKLFLGHSNFYKPLSFYESELLKNNDQKFLNLFAGFEYNTDIFSSRIAYFYNKSTNTPIPVYNNSEIVTRDSKIIYTELDKLETSGVNIKSRLKFWKILTSFNFNFYSQSEDSYFPKETEYNLDAGVYYIDTLYNSNLDLKTGITLHYGGDLEYRAYDFQQMRSASYYIENNSFKKFETYLVGNNPFRLDFLLAGRIQNTATFYFIYENLLGNEYYFVPYFPMPEGGIRIGISWDFIN